MENPLKKDSTEPILSPEQKETLQDYLTDSNQEDIDRPAQIFGGHSPVSEEQITHNFFTEPSNEDKEEEPFDIFDIPVNSGGGDDGEDIFATTKIETDDTQSNDTEQFSENENVAPLFSDEDKKEMDKVLGNQTTEEIIENVDEKISKDTPVTIQETSGSKKSKEIFENTHNKTLFEKLTDKAKSVVKNIYENNIKVQIVDRVKILYNEKLAQFHKNNLEDISKKINVQQGAMEKTQTDLTEFNTRIEKLKEQFGPLDPKTEAKAEKEQNKYESALKDAEEKHFTLVVKEEGVIEKINQYKQKKEEITETVKQRITEKISPLEGKIEQLKNEKEQLDERHATQKKTRDALLDRLEQVTEASKDIRFSFEKTAYKTIVNEAKQKLKIVDANIHAIFKDQEKINKKIEGIDGVINYWTNVRNKTLGIRENLFSEDTETINTDDSIDSENNSTEDIHTDTEVETVEQDMTPEHNNLETSLNQITRYRERWNHYFGKSFPLNETDLAYKKITTLQSSVKSILTGKEIDLESLVENAIREKNSTLPQEKIYSERALNAIFETMRDENIFQKNTYQHAA